MVEVILRTGLTGAAVASVQAVADNLEVQALKARYCEAVDLLPSERAHGLELLRSVFAEDAEADYGAEVFKGREAILAFLAHLVGDEREWIQHVIGTPNVRVNGDTATGKWTCSAHMIVAGTRAQRTLIGRYTDEFARTAEGWRISRVVFRRELEHSIG